MRASCGTANSLARVFPWTSQSAGALAVAMLERPGSNISVTPRFLSRSSLSRLIRAPRVQVNRPRGLNNDSAIKEKHLD